MSGIAVESCGFGNLSLGIHSADFGIFGASQTPSLVSAPKTPKNYESQTENLSVVVAKATNLQIKCESKYSVIARFGDSPNRSNLNKKINPHEVRILAKVFASFCFCKK